MWLTYWVLDGGDLENYDDRVITSLFAFSLAPLWFIPKAVANHPFEM